MLELAFTYHPAQGGTWNVQWLTHMGARGGESQSPSVVGRVRGGGGQVENSHWEADTLLGTLCHHL
jgi:hypothetical protein